VHHEFHIIASGADTCFTVQESEASPGREFSSLFEAARHARTMSNNAGFVVIYDESANYINRIPFSISS
jgi:hypothetical protein